MLIVKILLLVLGFIMLIKGADWFVDGAAGLAKKLKISEIIIGLTVVAMGTSLPEASVSISSAVKNSADLAVGNVVGSNIMNILIILGITAIISPLAVQKETMKRDLPLLIFVSAMMIFFCWNEKINRIGGIVMLAIFVLYLIVLVRNARKGNMQSDTKIKNRPMWQLLLLLVVGLVIVIIGSNITVDSASYIAASLGVSERVIGLTVVAFGTSLPELVTCIMAAKKNSADLAIGNIIGSNIFNILLVLGVTALFTEVPYQLSFMKDTLFAVLSSIMVLVGSLICKNKLTRLVGILFVLTYCIYFVVAVI